MTIKEYIESKEHFKLMPFMTVYSTILELVNDGYIAPILFEFGGSKNVEISQSKPEGEVSRGLYCSSDFHSNR